MAADDSALHRRVPNQAHRVVICHEVDYVRAAMTAVAERAGFTVASELAGAGELRQTVVELQPALVVFDMAPKTTGPPELAALLKAAPDVLTVVFSDHQPWREQALAAGITAWVDKPEFDHLAAVLQGLYPGPG